MRHYFNSYDVIVIGSGLGASMAALNAKAENLDVLQVMNTGKLSGSSFSEYTWGLGIVGPETVSDEQSLINAINEVGLGMTSPELVKTFAENISESVDFLKELGLSLERNNQKTVPCFDHKNRQWYGLMKDKNRVIFEAALKRKNVIQKKNIEIIALEKLEKLNLKGFLLTGLNHLNQREYFYGKSVILATGGLSYLYQNNFASLKSVVNGQYLALQCGCHLSNLEFFQWIPSYRWPIKHRIFNEYTFRDLKLSEAFAKIIAEENITDYDHHTLLKLRSGHGPFTSRLPSKVIDLALIKYNLSCSNKLQYKKEMVSIDHSMVSRYFKWLENEINYKKEEPFQLEMAAHASNGGILINTKGETNVPGLYACGEVTTGMEGADRIGGLATASAITFGRIAGNASKTYVNDIKEEVISTILKDYIRKRERDFNSDESKNKKQEYSTCDLVIHYSKKIMTTYGGIISSDSKLKEGIGLLNELMKILSSNELLLKKKELRKFSRAKSMVTIDLKVLESMHLRKESRGSHYRSDYPELDDEFSHQIIVSKDKNKINYQLKNKVGD